MQSGLEVASVLGVDGVLEVVGVLAVASGLEVVDGVASERGLEVFGCLELDGVQEEEEGVHEQQDRSIENAPVRSIAPCRIQDFHNPAC